jgi:Secretion system C-terminal sorting domain
MNLKQTLTASVLYLLALNAAHAQTPLIDEEFEGTSIPAGWIGSLVHINNITINNNNNACAGSLQSIAFNASNDALITPILHDPLELKFLYLRSTNTAAWTLNVQYALSTSGPWMTLSSVTNAGNPDCMDKIVDLHTYTDIYIRFLDARGSGGAERYIDNVVVSQREVLSVSILDFTAKFFNSSVKLDWSTANEKDNSHFDIERSLDGKSFSKIGQVKGNGTTTQTRDYTYSDINNSNKTTYYRLKQVDLDGKTSFSKVVSVNSGLRIGKTKVYPTLVNDWITVDLNAPNNVELIVSDILGRLILSKKVENTEGPLSLNLDLNNLTKGMYFMSIKSNFGVETVKIQKL